MFFILFLFLFLGIFYFRDAVTTFSPKLQQQALCSPSGGHVLFPASALPLWYMDRMVRPLGRQGFMDPCVTPNCTQLPRVAMKIPLTLSQGTHQPPDTREAQLRAMGTRGVLPNHLGFCAAKWLPCFRAEKEQHEGDGDSRQGFLLIQCCFL